MITVTAGIIVRENKIFAARRKPGLHLQGKWEFPGGKVLSGETPEEGLVRELKEELGISCHVESYIGESVFDYGSKTVRLLGFVVSWINGTITLTDHDKMLWLYPAELPKLDWAPADIALLEIFQQGQYLPGDR